MLVRTLPIMFFQFRLRANKVELCSAARKLVYCLRMPTDEHRVKVGVSWLTKTAIDSLASVQNAVSDMLTSPP